MLTVVAVALGPLAASAAEPDRPAAAPTATPTDPRAVERRGGNDRPSGEPLIGAGRSTNAVQSSGDAGGTAAGMPSNRKADGR
jgi:hypothetical protein